MAKWTDHSLGHIVVTQLIVDISAVASVRAWPALENLCALSVGQPLLRLQPGQDDGGTPI